MSAPSAAKASRYLWIVTGLIAAILLTIGALNVFADPFRVFGTARRTGWNDRVPDTSGFDRMAKPYELLHVQPRTVLFGSSTARAGFSGLADWKTKLPRPACNAALLGASAHEIRLSIEHALREAPVETVVMVADFFAFNAHYHDNERFEPTRLTTATRHGWPGMMGADFAAFTIGRDALGLSWQTLAASRREQHTEAAAVVADGYPWREHFRNCERSYLGKWLPPPERAYEFTSGGLDRLADFDASLQLCANRGVRTIVLCPPIHARFHEALAAAGVWPQYEVWKRELARRTRARQAQSANLDALALWDFSLFNGVTSEPLPGDGAGPMRYFSDSAHFTPELGARVLEEMLGTLPAGSQHLGVRLDRVDLEAHLASVWAGLETFRATQPGVVADVRDALGKTPAARLSSRP